MKKRIKIIIYLVILVLIGSGVIYFERNYVKGKNRVTVSNLEPSITPPSQTPQTTISQIPILMYHYIRDYTDQSDPTGIKLSVSPTSFNNQMKWLKDNNYQSVNPDYLDKPYAISNKPVVLTFDDGYRDIYENAYPILKKYNFTGMFYIITNVVGSPAYMTWDMIKEMKNNGMNFGSHTVTHPDLSKATNQQIDFQLSTSTEKLKSELGTDITDFCYPSGKYNDYTIAKLKELGYKTAMTTHTGIAKKDSNLFELPRIRVENDTIIGQKISKLEESNVQ